MLRLVSGRRFIELDHPSIMKSMEMMQLLYNFITSIVEDPSIVPKYAQAAVEQHMEVQFITGFWKRPFNTVKDAEYRAF